MLYDTQIEIDSTAHEIGPADTQNIPPWVHFHDRTDSVRECKRGQTQRMLTFTRLVDVN